MEEGNAQSTELKRQFMEFLDQDRHPGNYATKIGSMLGQSGESKEFRLPIDLADLRGYDVELHRSVLNDPQESLPPFEQALEETVSHRDPKWLPEGQRLRISLVGEFGAHTVSPRNLMAPFMSKIVNVQGIVTKASLVRPKMVKSVHFCKATETTTTREYRDVTTHDGDPTGSAYPTKDDEGNLLETEYGLCQYRDNQMLTIQELPETAPPGQLPRSVDIIMEEDLVDSVKPGDRVEIAGIYKAVAPTAKGSISGVFKAIVCGIGVKKLTKEIANHLCTKGDLDNIKNLAKDKEILKILGNSLAPSIFGHDMAKQALILLLLGGLEKNLANGTHLRGDINCLLVGDPGVAKSQLLRSVMNISPLAVNTTGRGSSGVGLTAAVTVDKDTGEKRLEAGAMVLADRGIVCIDEFDKMSDLDRVAIHEVMEQQTVTIAKAGIHTTLNARCSVVAAANPLYGSYEASLDKAKNINLPDSLLSRFDMIFVMLDDISKDAEISSHVLGQHRYRAPGDDGGIELEQDVHNLLGVEDEDGEGGKVDTEVRVKFNSLLHKHLVTGTSRNGEVEDKQLPLSHPFLKRYIHYAKERYKPELTPDASDEIVAYYTALRQFQACPKVTVRMLETIIRLSTAHAKLRLSKDVEVSDVDAIRGILDHVTGFHSEGTDAGTADDIKQTAHRSLDKREQDTARIEKEERKRLRDENRQAGKSKKKTRTTKGKKKSKTTQDEEEEIDEEAVAAMESEEAKEEAEEEDPVDDEEEDDVPDEDEEEEEEEEEAAEEEEDVQGSAPVDVGSQGIETEQVVEALKKLINSAEFRNHADHAGAGVRVTLMLSMLHSDYGMPGLTTQRLKEALDAFMAEVPDAIMLNDDRVLII